MYTTTTQTVYNEAARFDFNNCIMHRAVLHCLSDVVDELTIFDPSANIFKDQNDVTQTAFLLDEVVDNFSNNACCAVARNTLFLHHVAQYEDHPYYAHLCCYINVAKECVS